MTRFIEPISERTRLLADFAQPVIVAMGTAGLTGGAMAAMGMIADGALRMRRMRTH
ncbi:hypothetical protein [Novosphingobium sp. AP12]|uniref:hypothetical protein n=1 Tax=Novosphingobium sp. AP12 TaxID=1144305 RepID=UPI0002720B6A|nr:hypothetical protein [Novosphingobium sp. AP12]EJL20991.1 hypothetical protein PMI02_05315 [Novosphingobium sp. AP12]